jgi:hypothetical protein
MGKKVRSALIVCAIFTIALLSAPAFASEDKPSWLQYQGYDKSNSLSNNRAHLSGSEIKSWAGRRTVEALSFHPFSYESERSDLRRFFTDKGWEEYTAYLDWVKIPGMVNKEKYSLTSIIEQELQITSQEEIDGYISWVIKGSLLLSFHEAYTETTNKHKRPVASATIDLTLTIKRVDKGADSNNIAIHGWRVKPPK